MTVGEDIDDQAESEVEFWCWEFEFFIVVCSTPSFYWVEKQVTGNLRSNR